ncbi:MAG: HTTM domain-containing protein [Polyangiaceae bacterium]|nr:HTTM domain-containing protein [Polyangiaceae bacterium]
MKRLSRLWQGFQNLVSTQETGEVMALFRIFTGVIVVWVLASMFTTGIIDIVWVDRIHGGYRALGEGSTLVKWLGGPKPTVIHSLGIVTLVGGALVTLGLGGRLSAFVTLQGYMALHRLDGNASGSSDILVTNGLWLIVLANSTATWSLDCKIRTGRFVSNDKISAFPRYLGILQLIVMYWATGVQKVSVYWFPAGSYSALYYVLQQPTWQRFSMAWAAKFYPLTQIATAVTWLWEFTAPILFVVYWYRYTRERPGRVRAWFNKKDLRLPWIFVGIVLHLMILAAMDVSHFSQMSLAFYVCFWTPDEVVNFLRRAARKNKSAPSPADARENAVSKT